MIDDRRAVRVEPEHRATTETASKDRGSINATILSLHEGRIRIGAVAAGEALQHRVSAAIRMN